MTETEFISEHIPPGLPQRMQANGNDTILKDQRFSAACCGELQFAGFWRRLSAFIIDRIILYFAYLFIFLAGMAGLPQGFPLNEERLPLETVLDLGLEFAVSYFLAVVLVNMAYFTSFHGATGQTPGKMLLGIKVVRMGGGKMTYGIAFLRWVGHLISGAVLCLGFLWMLVDKRNQGWHDKIAGTFVVRATEEIAVNDQVDRFGAHSAPS